LFLDSGVPGFGCPGVVFLFTEFPLRQQISCLFQILHLRYFVAHKHTLGYLEVIILFFTWVKSHEAWINFHDETCMSMNSITFMSVMFLYYE